MPNNCFPATAGIRPSLTKPSSHTLVNPADLLDKIDPAQLDHWIEFDRNTLQCVRETGCEGVRIQPYPDWFPELLNPMFSKHLLYSVHYRYAAGQFVRLSPQLQWHGRFSLLFWVVDRNGCDLGNVLRLPFAS